MADLYRELAAKFPDSWGHLPSGVALDFARDFEGAMCNLIKTCPLYLPGQCLLGLQRDMAEYFAEFEPGPDSLYVRLARDIRNGNWSGGLVTLNYDVLLGRSLRNCGLGIRYSGLTFGNGSGLELCCLHGGCSFFLKGFSVSTMNVENGLGWGGRADGTLIPIIDPVEIKIELDRGNLPSMSFIDPDKLTFIGSGFVFNRQWRYSQLIHSAKSIALIGVHCATPDHPDRHIWQPLAGTKAKLIYCSLDTDDFEAWRVANRPLRNDDVSLRGPFETRYEEIMRLANVIV